MLLIVVEILVLYDNYQKFITTGVLADFLTAPETRDLLSKMSLHLEAVPWEERNPLLIKYSMI